MRSDPGNISKLAKLTALELGFDLVTISSAAPLDSDGERYREWRDKSFAADLAYMKRENPRRWIPQDMLPSARSVVTFGVNFASQQPRADFRKGYGRIARYAWGKDYHLVIEPRLKQWVSTLSQRLGQAIQSKILVDSGPLLERAFAHQSGAGFVGKNTMLIHRGMGSYLFLSEVLLDLELEPDPPPVLRAKDECGSCKACLDQCPTQALVSARWLDARKCISYWTIENRGPIPLEIRPGIGDWIFGCDICQEVCPYNALPRDTKWKEFLPESGAGPYLSIMEILSIKTDEEFRNRFAGTPILRAKRVGLIRNACVVAANQKFEESVPLLKVLAESDPDPNLSEHAKWALNQF